VRPNGDWFARFGFAEMLRLLGYMTVQRMLERDDFSKRFSAKEPISVSELLYPLMQGYDSVAIEADVELGGTDQLYNLLAGRDVMEAYGLEPQVALTTPILVSWDGEKMSSSMGNNIPLTAPPEEMFGRTMRVPDELLPEWYRLVWEREVPANAVPLEAKLALARFIVERSHGEEAARKAEEHFTRVVREGQAPDDVPEIEHSEPTVHLPALLSETFGQSTSHWRRVIDQGGVRADGRVLDSYDVETASIAGEVIQAGKRQFFRIRAA
jgi:tyrosyl-tRNA synthetase